jgi:dipeptidyl aminopeptidase/acylaminoacyl peptidase
MSRLDRTRPMAWTSRTLLGFGLATAVAGARADEPVVSFSRQVMPVLQRRCQGCHQPGKPNGKLDLTSYEALKKGGDAGAGFLPGKPDESPLVENVVGKTPDMPPNATPLAADEVALITRWVAQGATDDTPPAARDTIDAAHPPLYNAPPLITALAFSPDGQMLAISGYREVLIHKGDGTGLLHRLVGQAQRIEGLTFSPDAKTLAVVGGSPGRFGEVQFWDPQAAALKSAIRSTYDTLYGGAYSPDGKRFAFGCADNSTRLVSVADGKETLRVDHHSDWVFGTTFSLNGKHLITLGRDGAIKLTEVDTGSFIDDIGKNYGELKVLARNPKADQVAIGGDERVPRLYQIFRTHARDMNYTDFNLLKAFELQPGPISAIAISPDGNTLAVGGVGGEARLYKNADAARLQTFKGHRGGIYAIAFSPDGKHLATGGFDGSVRLFDVANGSLLREFVPVPIEAPSVALKAGQ